MYEKTLSYYSIKQTLLQYFLLLKEFSESEMIYCFIWFYIFTLYTDRQYFVRLCSKITFCLLTMDAYYLTTREHVVLSSRSWTISVHTEFRWCWSPRGCSHFTVRGGKGILCCYRLFTWKRRAQLLQYISVHNVTCHVYVIRSLVHKLCVCFFVCVRLNKTR